MIALNIANPKILATTLDRVAGTSNQNLFSQNTVSRSLDTINLKIGSFIGDGIGRRSSHAKTLAEIFKETPLKVDWVNSFWYEEGHRNILAELGILGFIIYYGFHFSLILFALKKCRIRERRFPLLVTAILFHIFTLYTTYSNVFFVTILVILTYAAGFQFIHLHEKKLKS